MITMSNYWQDSCFRYAEEPTLIIIFHYMNNVTKIPDGEDVGKPVLRYHGEREPVKNVCQIKLRQ